MANADFQIFTSSSSAAEAEEHSNFRSSLSCSSFGWRVKATYARVHSSVMLGCVSFHVACINGLLLARAQAELLDSGGVFDGSSKDSSEKKNPASELGFSFNLENS